MVDVEIIKEWISKADDDFEFALINLQEGRRKELFRFSFPFPSSAVALLRRVDSLQSKHLQPDYVSSHKIS